MNVNAFDRPFEEWQALHASSPPSVGGGIREHPRDPKSCRLQGHRAKMAGPHGVMKPDGAIHFVMNATVMNYETTEVYM